jgi:hypothetical protein
VPKQEDELHKQAPSAVFSAVGALNRFLFGRILTFIRTLTFSIDLGRQLLPS